MQVIASKQTLLFVNPDGSGDVRVTPQSYLQTLPDWVKDTSTYYYASQAGLVTEMVAVEPSKKDKDEKDDKSKSEKEPEVKQGEPIPTHTQSAHHTQHQPEPQGNKSTKK